MTSAAQAGQRIALRHPGSDAAAWTVTALFTPIQALIVAPDLLFIAALGLMLFHPLELNSYCCDRAAFGLLILVVVLRAFALQQPLQISRQVTWPMLGLLTLALCGVLAQPYDPETWSVYAAKWLVPFALFQLAIHVFDNRESLRRFETFALIVLGYLSVIAILFMAGANEFIYPRYILDEGLGIHADRARGPFLQAVANGVALNLLGLVALDSFRRKRLRGMLAVLVLAALPLAIVATKTRAVWLSFAASILALFLFAPSQRLRRACLCLALAGSLGLLAYVSMAGENRSLSDRLEESGPVKFRMAVYQAGWEMFLKKPLAGWGAVPMQAELSKRISEFHQEQFYFHNTYLEVLVQYGLAGFALYVWLIVDLFRVGRKRKGLPDGVFLDGQFRWMWPLFLGVYLLNGSFVVMNYQFVNGFLFTVAGLLVAQNRRVAEAGGIDCEV
jgi:putative inorganic carbon (HCO3(-)) transporter